MSNFCVGQRVIVTHYGGAHDGVELADMNGYYGHVVETYTGGATGRPMVDVSLSGRVGAAPRPYDLDPIGDDPWIFYADELQHAD